MSVTTPFLSKSAMSVEDTPMKYPRYFPYLVGVCILLCLGLFINRIFLLQKLGVIFILEILLGYIVNFLVVVSSFKLYKNAQQEDRKILIWFVIANIAIVLHESKGLYYMLYYMSFREFSTFLNIEIVHLFVSMTTTLIWAGTLIICLYKILTKYVVLSGQKVQILFVFIPVNIILILSYLFSVHYFTRIISLDVITQIMSSIVYIVVFDFVVVCLIYAENKGLIVFLLGVVVIISGYFSMVHMVYSQVNGYYRELAADVPSTYMTMIWDWGLLLNWIGILMIQYKTDYKIKNWIRRYNSIKSKLTFWVFSVSISSFLIFFMIAFAFSLISQTVLLGLPIFIMIYSTIIITLSIYVGGYFEAPFKQIIANIKALTLKNKSTAINAEFSIAEFMLLQNFITDSFERLKQTQEKFRTIVKQTLHDIQSPITSLNTIITVQSSTIPENTRVTLRHATDRIADIANNLIKQYQTKDASQDSDGNNVVLVALAILQIMREKRFEYSNSAVTFNLDFEPEANFTFIKIDSDRLKRMLSNLINNAVEAVHTDGMVTVKLGVTGDNVTISVKDNGYGMPKHIQDKFQQGTSVSEGKEKGQGLGLIQIKETIQSAGGRLAISAINNVGTEIMITFPRIAAPGYISSEIRLTPADTVIILDDDESIHGAWDAKFENILTQYSTLHMKHFTNGQEAITYINRLGNEEKNHVLLLTDYELLGQGMNGLDVVAQTQIKRAILVTSWATNTKIQEMVVSAGITTIPKELTYAVSMIVDLDGNIGSTTANTNTSEDALGTKTVDMIWLEDNKWFVDSMVDLCFKQLVVDVYYDPVSFMQNIQRYPLNTRIILDTFYKTPDGTEYPQTGYTLATELHQMGYTKLILFSGDIDIPPDIPKYLTIISKHEEGSVNLLATI